MATDEIFELNLIFEGDKNPSEAFVELTNVFESLASLDRLFLSSIDNKLAFDYSLRSLEFSSIKTWIAQRVREIPDDAIKDFDWKKLVGHFLLKLKYRVLRYLEKNPLLDTKESLVEVSKILESEKNSILGNQNRLISDVNTYLLLNALEQIIDSLKQLKEGEMIEFKTDNEAIRLSNKVSLNKAKILWELGDQKFESETTEILKIKRLDLLSNNSLWIFKLGNKAIEAKIVDQPWLNKYHSREFPLLPEDSLKVKLRVYYTNRPDGSIAKTNFEITEVLDIIYPENNQTSLYQS